MSRQVDADNQFLSTPASLKFQEERLGNFGVPEWQRQVVAPSVSGIQCLV